MIKFKILALLLILSMLFVTAGGPTPNVAASPSAGAPNLGKAASFVGLAASTFTNTGSGVYYGNVGVSPGSAVDGFPPGEVKNGDIYEGGPVPMQAQLDARAAYNDLKGHNCDTDMTGVDLGGKTLQPGVYCFDTSAQLTGDLVLDALGDSNALWVFQTGSTLKTGPGSTVRLINGAQIFNVFWQVGSSATLDTTTRFKGTIIAEVSISLKTGASLSGRALALTGGVTMDTEGSPPMSNPQLGIVKQVYPVSALPGQVITYTITFANYGSELVTGIMISDTIPISVTNTSVISSGVAITQVNGSRYAWDIAPLEVGQGGIITITGQLSSTLPGGTFTNTATITSTELVRDFENDTSRASVTVVPMTDLRIVKDVSSIYATPGQPITYTLTFSNAGNERVTGVVITDIIPITVTNTSVISSGVAITQVNGSRYVWDIAPLNIGQGGVITITGVLSDELQFGTIFTNTAVITTTSATETDPINNTSSASVTIAEIHTLTLATAGDGAGTLTPEVGSHEYPSGTTAIVTATAQPGSEFAGWHGATTGMTNPAHILMDADQVLTATFRALTYTLTVDTVGEGTVTRAPSQTTYLYGNVITLTAEPETGWYFGQWSGDASGILTQTTVTITADKVVTATFTETPPTYYTLTLSIIGSGVITPEVGAHSYLSGTVVDLSASPAAGWQFDGWSGDLDNAANSAQVTMDADKAITATFAAFQVGVAFTPDHDTQAQPGKIVTFTHTLTNTGSTTDTYYLDGVNDQDWLFTLFTPDWPEGTLHLWMFEVGPQATRTITVSVFVPADAIGGTVGTTTITATSQLDPDVSDFVQNMTTISGAEKSYIFLPLVVRNH